MKSLTVLLLVLAFSGAALAQSSKKKPVTPKVDPLDTLINCLQLMKNDVYTFIPLTSDRYYKAIDNKKAAKAREDSRWFFQYGPANVYSYFEYGSKSKYRPEKLTTADAKIDAWGDQAKDFLDFNKRYLKVWNDLNDVRNEIIAFKKTHENEEQLFSDITDVLALHYDELYDIHWQLELYGITKTLSKTCNQEAHDVTYVSAERK